MMRTFRGQRLPVTVAIVTITTLIALYMLGTGPLVDMNAEMPRMKPITHSKGTLASNRTNLLIVAYKRTGSTFLGQLLGARDDTFFWHEPLRFLRRNYYYRGEDLICDYYTPKCYIQSRTDELTREDYTRILQEIFDCNFTSVATADDLALNLRENERSISWKGFGSCTKYQTHVACLPKLVNACKASKHRLIKVVRTDLEGISNLYATVPNLKIVQLFRDVRGIVNSRLRTPWYADTFLKTPRQVEDDVSVLCSVVRNNLQTAKRFTKERPTKFKVVQYEDFAVLNAKLCKLLTWLNMDCSEIHLNQSLALFQRPENTLSGYRSKSVAGNHPDLYRTQLDWEVTKMVDRHCADLYGELGFRTFSNELNFRDLSISSWISERLPFEI